MRSRNAGFTLIELVAVIILLGIVGTGVVAYLRTSMQAYVEVIRRDDIAQVGRFALERISRELRNALPGSIRVSNNCIEFVPVLAASSYLTLPVGVAANSFQAADFTPPTSGGLRVAVYTIANSDVYGAGSNNLAAISNIGAPLANVRTVTLSANHQFPTDSPTRRFFIVNQPVSFCVQGTTITRHEQYGYNAVQPAPPAGGVLLAEFVQLNDGGPVTPFRYTPGTLQRGGSVHVDLRFLAANTSDEWVRFSHDIAVRSVP